MKLDIKKVEEAILGMEEKEPGQEKEDVKKLLCVISGNKSYLSQIELDDILYLIENVDEILEKEMDYTYPEINLKKVSRCKSIIRRAI